MIKIASLKLFHDDVCAVAEGSIFNSSGNPDLSNLSNFDVVALTTNATATNPALLEVINYCKFNAIDLVVFGAGGTLRFALK